MSLTNVPAQASSIGGLFELDGNPVAGAAPGDDWSTLVGSGVGTAPGFVAKTSVPIADADSPTDVSYFTGGGSKDVQDVSSWQHSPGDVAPDKDEILNAFAAAYRTGNVGDATRDLILFFGSDRFANSGDAQMGFWFFRSEVSLNSNGTFNGTHTAKTTGTGAHGGDLLVLSDFSGGGRVSTINVYEWVGGKNPLAHLNTGSGSVDCADATHNANVCAVENSSSTASSWSYTPKAGTTGNYPIGSFLEGGINITNLVGGGDQCFASFLAETRSSTSTTAQLKDFALGRFPICAPTTTMSASPALATPATVHRGEGYTISFNETNDGDLPLSSPHVTTTGATCGDLTTISSGDTNANGNLDPGETLVFTCSLTNLQSDTTVVGTGHGTDFRGKDVTYCETGTTPANTVCDNDERATAKVKVINPQTTLAMSASPATVHVGDTVTLSFTETNNGTRSEDNLTAVSVSAPRCSTAPALNPSTQSSDLPFGESRTFSCTFTAAATDSGATLAAIASGTDSLGSTVTYCTNAATPPSGVYCSQNERATTSITVINPSTSLRATASAVVTYTFVETNNGDSAISSPTLSAPGCDSAITVTNRSLNSDGTLDVGESWTYTCTKTVAGPTVTDGVTVTGTGSGTDSAGATVTACDGASPSGARVCVDDERDSVTVKITHNAPN